MPWSDFLSVSSSTPRTPKIELVNSHEPRAGIHLKTFTAFKGNGLQVIAYKRNTWRGDELTGLKTCMKVLAAPRKEGRSNEYESWSSDRCISMELKMEAMGHILAVLTGQRPEALAEIKRPGATPKSLTLRVQQQREAPFNLMLTEGGKTIGFALSKVDAFEIVLIGAVVLKDLHPELPEQMVFNTFLRFSA